MRMHWAKFLHSTAAIALCFAAIGLVTVSCESLRTDGGRSMLGLLGGGQNGEPTLAMIVSGLKEALQVGTERTVSATSRAGGYLDNPRIRIPMPEKLQGMSDTLRKVGMGAQVDNFERKMNEAAEQAAKSATPVFVDAIRQMTFEDAKAILHGSDSAATEYFRGKTTAPLKERYRPIVTGQMTQLGVVKAYDDLQTRYNQIPLVPKSTVSVEDYVTDKALQGLFTVLAGEEKKIRQDPAARTTALLKQVFGGKE